MFRLLKSRGLKCTKKYAWRQRLHSNPIPKTRFPIWAHLPTLKQSWLFFKFNLEPLIFTFCLLTSISALLSPNCSTLHLYKKLEERFCSFWNNEFGTLVLSVLWWKVCWHVKWTKTNAFSCFLFSSIAKRALIKLLSLFQPFESIRNKPVRWLPSWQRQGVIS